MSKKVLKRSLILASASKRRSEILHSCGISHKVVASEADEIVEIRAHRAEWVVKKNAEIKAEKVSGEHKEAIVIGADTLVLLKDELIGKPKNEVEARSLLERLSGQRVEVFTAIFLMDGLSGKSVLGVEKSSLYVKKMTVEEIDRFFVYLAPYDKAGGFSIEGVGSMLFDDIRGSYFNILGLPMGTLRDLFVGIGLDILDFISIQG
ncbi:MAG: Maf family protein [Candidatus Omnitrophota bacterium]